MGASSASWEVQGVPPPLPTGPGTDVRARVLSSLLPLLLSSWERGRAGTSPASWGVQRVSPPRPPCLPLLFSFVCASAVLSPFFPSPPCTPVVFRAGGVGRCPWVLARLAGTYGAASQIHAGVCSPSSRGWGRAGPSPASWGVQRVSPPRPVLLSALRSCCVWRGVPPPFSPPSSPSLLSSWVRGRAGTSPASWGVQRVSPPRPPCLPLLSSCRRRRFVGSRLGCTAFIM